jgi:hypothetical protein
VDHTLRDAYWNSDSWSRMAAAGTDTRKMRRWPGGARPSYRNPPPNIHTPLPPRRPTEIFILFGVSPATNQPTIQPKSPKIHQRTRLGYYYSSYRNAHSTHNTEGGGCGGVRRLDSLSLAPSLAHGHMRLRCCAYVSAMSQTHINPRPIQQLGDNIGLFDNHTGGILYLSLFLPKRVSHSRKR